MAAEDRRTTDKTDHGDRISRIEVTVDTLTTSLTSLSAHVDALAKNVSESFGKIYDKLDNYQKDTKPQWGALAAWTTVLIMLFAAFGGLAKYNMSIETQLNNEIQNVKADYLKQQIDVLRARVEKVEDDNVRDAQYNQIIADNRDEIDKLRAR